MKPLALVADDYAGITQQLRSALEHSGFEVITAEDGQEALDKFKEERRTFALIVVDYMMPRVKGDAVIGAIKAYLDERNQPAPKMFLLTGSDDSNMIARARATGLAEILLKPDGIISLLDRIQGKPLLAA
jgi:CheY-like chemotaxis protein